MKRISFLFLFLGCVFASKLAATSKLYVSTFGDATHPALVFLHGGPGYNCASFEIACAQELADQGFFVICYDRRGAGRSKVKKAEFTFEEAVEDLKKVIHKQKLKKVTLLGHSFGGALALRFAQKYPDLTSLILLISAPMDFPATFRTIRQKCTMVYEAKQDSMNLDYMNQLAQMDESKLEYANYCFFHAMQAGLYQVDQASTESNQIYQEMMTDYRAPFLMVNKTKPVVGFYENENYTSLDFHQELEKVILKIPVKGIYGDQDGLFDLPALKKIMQIVGFQNFEVLENASHSVFIDQRTEFIRLVKKFTQKP